MKCRGMDKDYNKQEWENMLSKCLNHLPDYNINGEEVSSFKDIAIEISDGALIEIPFNERIEIFCKEIGQTVGYSIRQIRSRELPIDTYYFVIYQINYVVDLAAKCLGICKEHIKDEVVLERVMIGLSKKGVLIDQIHLKPNMLSNMYLNEIERIKNELAPHDYEAAKKDILHHKKYSYLFEYCDKLIDTVYAQEKTDKAQRDIIRDLINYKPTKEQRLETYFRCNNFEALRSILHRDLQGKGGVAVARVLVALSKAGCKVIVNKFAPLFENILTPIYGVTGKRYSVSKYLESLNDVTEKSDKKTAKDIADLTQKYKNELK